MALPLVLLAIGAAAAGLIPFGHFVTSDGSRLESSVHVQFSLLPVGLALAGIFMATWMYKTDSDRPARVAASIGGLYKAAYHKFYIDEVYVFITKKILFNGIGKLAAWFDRSVVDGLVNLTGTCTVAISIGIKKMQSGKVQGYALYFLAGVIVLATLFIYVWR